LWYPLIFVPRNTRALRNKNIPRDIRHSRKIYAPRDIRVLKGIISLNNRKNIGGRTRPSISILTKRETNIWYFWTTYRDTRSRRRPTSGNKTKGCPPLKMNLGVGNGIDAVSKLMLGRPIKGNDMNDDIPHIEKPYVLGMVVEEPIPLMDGKE